MASYNYDYAFKIVIIGDSNVGKSCLLLRYTDDSFTANYLSTIAIDFKIKIINIDNKLIKLQIWDTAGQERFGAITKTYFKCASGIILIYDISNQCSFKNVINWIKMAEVNEPNAIKILVGNKCDKPDRVVTEEEGKELANKYNMKFFETSAKTNMNVKEAFEGLIKEILDTFLGKKKISDKVLNKDNTKEEKKGCNNEKKNNNKEKSKNFDCESEIKILKNPLDEEKNKNKELITENRKLNDRISKLSDELKKIKMSYETQINEIQKLLTEEKNKNELLMKENIKLSAQIKRSNAEINKSLKNNQEITSIKPGEEILAINFLSMGTQDIMNYCMPCKNTDLFVRFEEKLYEDFPKYKDYETFFEVKTKRIKRFKTLDENNIKSNDIISVFIVDN